MLNLYFTSQFKKDYKIIKKRNLPIDKLEEVLELLLAEKILPAKYHDHSLTENYKGFRECHVESDWLLVYAVDNEKIILTASRTGTHSDLF